MAEQGRAFQVVKDLLGKLDGSIDEARDRRLHGDRPRVEEPPRQAQRPSESTSVVNPPRPGSSKYGRAKPLRPNNDPPRWRS